MTGHHPTRHGLHGVLPRLLRRTLRVAIPPVALALAATLASPAAAQPARPAPFPAKPTAGESFEAWCARLPSTEPFVPFRCIRENDWTEPGHPSRTQRVRWAGTDVAGAFELARALFGVPASVTLPRTGPREQTIEDPRKPPEVWESTLLLKRGADAGLREARWFERREGGGRTVTARRIDARFVEVSEVAFAD